MCYKCYRCYRCSRYYHSRLGICRLLAYCSSEYTVCTVAAHASGRSKAGSLREISTEHVGGLLWQVEVDEYRDYEKAGGALREALKYMAKAGAPATLTESCKSRVCRDILGFSGQVHAAQAAGDTAESDERALLPWLRLSIETVIQQCFNGQGARRPFRKVSHEMIPQRGTWQVISLQNRIALVDEFANVRQGVCGAGHTTPL